MQLVRAQTRLQRPFAFELQANRGYAAALIKTCHQRIRYFRVRVSHAGWEDSNSGIHQECALCAGFCPQRKRVWSTDTEPDRQLHKVPVLNQSVLSASNGTVARARPQRAPERAPFPPTETDCVAEDAVQYEPVSMIKFPDKLGKYWEFCVF